MMLGTEKVPYPFDLNAPGAVDDLLAFHRQLSGGLRMMADDDDGDGDGGDGGEDDDLLDGDDDSDDDDDDAGGGDGGGDDQMAAMQRMLDAAVTKIQQQTTSEIDRRINQLSRKQQKDTGGRPQRQGPDPADLREARMVYREEVPQLIRMSGPEREFASDIAHAAIRKAVAGGADPETAGRDVAQKVAERMRGLRKHHQDRLVDGLVKRGVLERDAIRPGQQQGVSGGKKPDSVKQYQSGQSAAQTILQQRGRIAEKNE